MTVERQKATVYLDAELLRALRLRAAGTGRDESQVLEDAVRTYLAHEPLQVDRAALLAMLSQIGTGSELSDDEALALANEELHAARAERTNR